MRRFTFTDATRAEFKEVKEELCCSDSSCKYGKEEKVNNPYDIGRLLDDNKAIMNYIYDSVGFRIGVVVASAEEGKCHPSIGWALFDEVHPNYHDVKTLGDVPLFTALFDSSATSKDVAIVNNFILKNFQINQIPRSYGDLDRENRYKLVKLALDRRNHNAWDFYTSDDFKEADIRNNFIETTSEYESKTGLARESNGVWYDELTCKAIRKQVRDIEYRAYRYFK